MNLIKLIKKKKVPEILVNQLDNPKHIRGLRKELGGSPNTIDSAVQLLDELELVKVEKTKDFPYKKIPRLTEKGRKIATFLKNSGEIGKLRNIAKAFLDPRMKWPLMFAAKLGKVEGLTKFQKLFFLLDHEMGIDHPYTSIKRHHYGPYSEQLNRDVHHLATAELFDPYEDGYRLTEEGKRMAQEALESETESVVKAIEELEKFNRMKRRDLVNYVYKNYPKWRSKHLPPS